jgi:hypothetical protein
MKLFVWRNKMNIKMIIGAGIVAIAGALVGIVASAKPASAQMSGNNVPAACAGSVQKCCCAGGGLVSMMCQ